MLILKNKLFRNLLLASLGLFAAFLFIHSAGRILVIDEPKHADFIVVLSGDPDDVRFERGLTLLRSGYAQQLIFDVPNSIKYGRSLSDAAENYIRTTASDQVGLVHICTFSGDSTEEELDEVRNCIHSIVPDAASAIVVTSNFHTRRSFSIARSILPQYSWSVASASDTHFDVRWWRRREWAKTALSEWQKLLWWMIVEQWLVHQSFTPSSHSQL